MYAHSEYNHPIPGITVNIPLDYLSIWQNKTNKKIEKCKYSYFRNLQLSRSSRAEHLLPSQKHLGQFTALLRTLRQWRTIVSQTPIIFHFSQIFLTNICFSDVAPVPASPSIDNDHGFLPRFPLLPGLLSRLRYPNNNIIPAPVAPTTSYTTSTITKVSTITSGITEEIVITFLNRPITTNYVRTTTMVNRYFSTI